MKDINDNIELNQVADQNQNIEKILKGNQPEKSNDLSNGAELNKETLCDQISSLNSNLNNKIKIGEKTKLSIINGAFDVSLLINVLKNFILLYENGKPDLTWYIKISLVVLLFILQMSVFAILSSIALVKNKATLEKMNNAILVLSSFIFLFELVRNLL